MRDALETPRTDRARLAVAFVGCRQRDSAFLAAVAAIIARSSLTAIDTATFGLFNAPTGTDSVAITSGQTALTCADNPWTSADVGKRIDIAGAGAAGGTLSTTISAFVSAGAVTLADAAGTTVTPSKTSAAGLAIWGTAVSQQFLSSAILTADGLSERQSVSIPSDIPTAVESGPRRSPVITLTDGATITIDASLSEDYQVTLGGNRTLAAPTNPPANGIAQTIRLKVKQDGTGSRTLTWNAAFIFSTDVPQPTLSTAAGAVDMIGMRYDPAIGKWRVLAVTKGFAS